MPVLFGCWIGVLIVGPLLVCLDGCTNFSTNTWRTEQTAVNAAYFAYTGYTNWVALHQVDTNVANQVKLARLSFAGSISVVEAWRQSYETNSAMKPQLQAALDAALAQSSNVVWLVTFITKEH